MEENYVLVIDDTGYDFVSGDKKTLKYHVGILLPERYKEEIKKDIFRVMCGLRADIDEEEKSEVKEIHACEMLGLVLKEKIKESSLVKYYKRLFRIILNPKYDIKIFVSAGTIIRKDPSGKRMGTIQKRYVPWKKDNELTDLERFLSSKNVTERRDMIGLYYSAKKYLQMHGKGAKISSIYCDEGMRKEGSVVDIETGTTLRFVSSKISVLVQAVDNIAWAQNRAYVVTQEKFLQLGKIPGEIDRCSTNEIIRAAPNIVLFGFPLESELQADFDKSETGTERAKFDDGNGK